MPPILVGKGGKDKRNFFAQNFSGFRKHLAQGMGIVPAIKQDWRIIPDFLKAPGYEGFFKPPRNRGGIWLNTKFASNMFKGQARQPGIDALMGAGKTCGAIRAQI